MLRTSLAIFLLFCLNNGNCFFLGNEKVVKIEKFFGKCPEFNYLPVVYEDMSISQNEDSELLLNTTILVKEDINSPLRIEMKIERCETKGVGCELLHTVKHRRYCDMIESQSDFIWKQFFQGIKPKWKCPLKKGTYKAVNAAFDIGSFLLMAGDQSYWKIRSETFDANAKTIICIMGDAYIYSP